jgi:hypothetical protein
VVHPRQTPPQFPRQSAWDNLSESSVRPSLCRIYGLFVISPYSRGHGIRCVPQNLFAFPRCVPLRVSRRGTKLHRNCLKIGLFRNCTRAHHLIVYIKTKMDHSLK